MVDDLNYYYVIGTRFPRYLDHGTPIEKKKFV